MMRALVPLLLLTCSCSGGAKQDPERGALEDEAAAGAPAAPGVSHHPCSVVRLAPDGTCDEDGPYVACDPDCAAAR